MKNPKLIFYYHHYGGLGHGTRILAIIKSIKKTLPKSRIVVINSGLPQDFLGMEKFGEIVQLPPLVSKCGLFYGIKPNSKEDLKSVKNERIKKLKESFTQVNPDFLFIEHYPFGRDDLEKELSNFIKFAQKSNPKIKIFAIIRDLLCQRIDMKRLVNRARYFDGFFVLSDPSIFKIEKEISLPSEVREKMIYAGYAILSGKEELIHKEKIRKQLEIEGNTKLIVANIGGGIDGYNIIKELIGIKKELDKTAKYIFLIATGPSINEEEYAKIDKLRGKQKGILLTKFNPNLLDYINAADLSISMAGYNACVNAVITKTPTLLIPREDKEQTERARKFCELGYCRVLYQDNLNKEGLLSEIKKIPEYIPSIPNISLGGASFIAKFVAEYGKLEYIKIRLLTRCNCNCDMCTWILEDTGKEIPKEKIFGLYKQFKILGVRHINFTGGEPTLRKDIFELIGEGREECFKISISSNGNFDSSLGKKIMEAGIDMIDVSIDSANSKIHDKIRGEGVWKRAICNIKSISNYLKEISINFTIRKDNYREAERMIDLAKKCGAKKISFSMIYTMDNPKEEIKKLGLGEEELNEFYLEIVPKVLKKAVQKDIEIKFSPYFKELKNLPYISQALKILLNPKKFSTIIKERMVNKKPAERKSICSEIQNKSRIDTNGNISPCCTLDEECRRGGMGNVFKDNFVNIWLNEKYYKVRNSVAPSKKCFLCKIDSNNF